jgi:hypothetical protein
MYIYVLCRDSVSKTFRISDRFKVVLKVACAFSRLVMDTDWSRVVKSVVFGAFFFFTLTGLHTENDGAQLPFLNHEGALCCIHLFTTQFSHIFLFWFGTRIPSSPSSSAELGYDSCSP